MHSETEKYVIFTATKARAKKIQEQGRRQGQKTGYNHQNTIFFENG